MGLDAKVFCDCYERGRLRNQPPVGTSLTICADGSLAPSFDSGSLEADLAFDKWRWNEACTHQHGILLHHRLGNVSLIALLREEFSREPERFALLLSRVIQNGSHGGDSIPVALLPALEDEIQSLQSFRCKRKEAEPFIATFASQMRELTDVAASIQKPIAF